MTLQEVAENIVDELGIEEEPDRSEAIKLIGHEVAKWLNDHNIRVPIIALCDVPK